VRAGRYSAPLWNKGNYYGLSANPFFFAGFIFSPDLFKKIGSFFVVVVVVVVVVVIIIIIIIMSIIIITKERPTFFVDQ